MYITLTANKCSFSQLGVVKDGAFCDDSPVKCTYTEPLVGTKQSYGCHPNIVTAGISIKNILCACQFVLYFNYTAISIPATLCLIFQYHLHRYLPIHHDHGCSPEANLETQASAQTYPIKQNLGWTSHILK